MNNKVLVTVYVVKLDQSYEMFFPPNKLIGDIIFMIAKSLNETSNGVFQLDYRNILVDTLDGHVIDPMKSLKEVIQNGKKLILI